MSDSDPIVLVITGPQRGVKFALPEGRTTVGRTSHADIFLDDDLVSRQHALFDRTGKAVSVRDCGSTAGVWLDAHRVESADLSPQSVLRFGDTWMVFEPELELLIGGAEGVLLDPELDLAVSTGRPLASDPLLDALAEHPGSKAIAAALEQIAKQIQAERAFVLEFRAHEAPRVVATYGEELITVSRSVVRRALAGEAVWSPDASEDRGLGTRISLQAGQIRSLLALPLIAGGKPVGMIHLDRRQKNAWPESVLADLEPVARLCALALLAARAIKAERTAARMIDAPEIIAHDPAMQSVLRQMELAARGTSTVLIEGDTGTGKELLARALHTLGPRKDGPFVVVQLAAVPSALAESELFGHAAGAFTGARGDRAGLFEAADGGTLFFDDVQDAPAGVQRKLLRALQERVVHRIGEHHPRPVDVRVVAASSRSLAAEVEADRFRRDLYYRLAVVTLTVPRLSARPADIAPLTEHLLKQACAVVGRPPLSVAEAVQQRLLRHGWPGNVRELANLAERWALVVEAAEVSLADLPHEVGGATTVVRQGLKQGRRLADVVAEVEREMIVRVRDRTGAVKSATAEILGVSRVTLDKKIVDLGIVWKPAKRSATK